VIRFVANLILCAISGRACRRSAAASVSEDRVHRRSRPTEPGARDTLP